MEDADLRSSDEHFVVLTPLFPSASLHSLPVYLCMLPHNTHKQYLQFEEPVLFAGAGAIAGVVLVLVLTGTGADWLVLTGTGADWLVLTCV
jgi:O-antigen ligase